MSDHLEHKPGGGLPPSWQPRSKFWLRFAGASWWSDLSPVIRAFLNTGLRHVYSVYGRRVECTKMSVGTLRCADAFTEARGFLQVSEENRSQVSLSLHDESDFWHVC